MADSHNNNDSVFIVVVFRAIVRISNAIVLAVVFAVCLYKQMSLLLLLLYHYCANFTVYT